MFRFAVASARPAQAKCADPKRGVRAGAPCLRFRSGEALKQPPAGGAELRDDRHPDARHGCRGSAGSCPVIRKARAAAGVRGAARAPAGRSSPEIVIGPGVSVAGGVATRPPSAPLCRLEDPKQIVNPEQIAGRIRFSANLRPVLSRHRRTRPRSRRDGPPEPGEQRPVSIRPQSWVRDEHAMSRRDCAGRETAGAQGRGVGHE